MSRRGMIMQERTDAVLTSVVRDAFARLPRATWVTADELVDASPELARCGGGRYEVVKLGATVSREEIQDAALKVMRHAEDLGLRISHDRKRGFSVFDPAHARPA